MRRIALTDDEAAFFGRIAAQNTPAQPVDFSLAFVALATDVCVTVFQESLIRLPCRSQLAPFFNRLRTTFAPPLHCGTHLV